MKLKEGFLLREIAGQQVVVPTGSDLNMSMMITLNDTGATLWKRLEAGAEMADLVAALTAEYDVDETTAAASAARFVEKLKQNDFLE